MAFICIEDEFHMTYALAFQFSFEENPAPTASVTRVYKIMLG